MSHTDRLILWTAGLLVLLAPLPLGSADPWALTAIEAAIFSLLIVREVGQFRSNASWIRLPAARSLLIPIGLFAVLVGFQLVPLPPAVLRVLSPSTYHLNQISFPGWPEKLPYQQINLNADRWRPLSIGPSLGPGVLLELGAYASLFFLIVFGSLDVPSGEAAERRRCRIVVTAVLLSGLAVAGITIVQQFTWNGRMLWMFVPYDWGVPHPAAMPRASGPFVSPDHCGDYLAIVLPMAVAGMLFRTRLFSAQAARPFRLFCGVTAFLVLCALMLTLSRGAWVGAAIGLALLISLSGRMPKDACPDILRRARGTLVRSAVAGVCVAITIALLFIGPKGREQVDLRLRETIEADTGFGGRLTLAADTLAMVRDYPLFGVGLGCFPELFPRYRPPPWSPDFYREAHNDYAQLLAETGLAGFVLFGWFFVVVGLRISRAFISTGPQAPPPILVAVCAALAVAAFHEFFDFSLHTPANALLFTILLGLALRMAMDEQRSQPHANGARFEAVLLSAGAVVLIVCALSRQKVPYPYNIPTPRSPADAAALIRAHPAQSQPHLQLVGLAGPALSREQRSKQLYAAVWLDPLNPSARDLYAMSLIREGRTASAMAEITRSVSASPAPATHFYLSAENVPRLLAAERDAVERGLREALANGYEGAVDDLAQFYQREDRFAQAGLVYADAAGRVPDRETREEYLIDAALAYSKARNTVAAEKILLGAVSNQPRDERPYQLLAMLYLSRRNAPAAERAIQRGIAAGADPSVLYEALARSAQVAGDMALAESSLRKAIDVQPSFAALYGLGMLYLDERRFAHAALMMRRAIEADPQSADAYFYLGAAQEDDYRFADAEKNFAHAVELAPSNAGYRNHYHEFEMKLAENLKAVDQANR